MRVPPRETGSETFNAKPSWPYGTTELRDKSRFPSGGARARYGAVMG